MNFDWLFIVLIIIGINWLAWWLIKNDKI